MFANGSRANYYQRLLSTAIAYSAFGLGGLCIYLCYPILWLLPINKAKKRHYGRRLIHHSFRFFIFLMKTLGIYTYEVHGAELLQRPGQLIVANHPSLIDVVFLLSLIPETNCIVRYGLIRNPFTRGPLKTADYIVNENPEQLIADCVATLQDNHSLLIFPEGTRTKPQQPLSFKKGTANIALRSQTPLTPVVITCQPPMLQKGVKWYRIPKCRPHFIISVKKPFLLQSYLDENHALSVKSRHLSKDLREYFEQEINAQQTHNGEPRE